MNETENNPDEALDRYDNYLLNRLLCGVIARNPKGRNKQDQTRRLRRLAQLGYCRTTKEWFKIATKGVEYLSTLKVGKP